MASTALAGRAAMPRTSLIVGALLLASAPGCGVRRGSSTRAAAAIPPPGILPCSPIEVAPGVFERPPCGVPPIGAPARFYQPPLGLRTQSFPPSVDHRLDGTESRVKDQGQVGVCWDFALTTLI